MSLLECGRLSPPVGSLPVVPIVAMETCEVLSMCPQCCCSLLPLLRESSSSVHRLLPTAPPSRPVEMLPMERFLVLNLFFCIVSGVEVGGGGISASQHILMFVFKGLCNFEVGTCGWTDTSESESYSWKRRMANITAAPGVDHTTGDPSGTH